MIKEVEEREMSLDMRLPNASNSTSMRDAHRDEGGDPLCASLCRVGREMAAKEKNETRKAELIAIAETCEWVPEHPARNLREAIQCHFFCHLVAELEQIGWRVL